jgi:hypothetical protein
MTEDLQDRVRDALLARAVTVPEPEQPDWAAIGRRQAQRKRTRFAPIAASVAVLITLTAGLLIGVGIGSPRTRATFPHPAPVNAHPAATCVANVPSRVLPQWARGGFTEVEPRMPYVLGARGDIAAILFGNPLAAPPRRHLSNKILWVSRVSAASGDPLIVDARLDGSQTTVRRTVPGGPGPSIIDLPQSGCWHLTLTWSQHTDTLDLRYTRQSHM